MKMNSITSAIALIKICFCLFICFALSSCEKDEADEDECMETICPEGYNSCIERPCDFDEYR